ncbi:unnamed protein product, partial [Tetraodon nigroviridis]
FDGRVVAKLPFVPLSYIQGLSHRNLLGEDYTDCSFIFLYILCTMSIRQNIQKMLGLAPSRAATKQAGGFLDLLPKQPSSPKHPMGCLSGCPVPGAAGLERQLACLQPVPGNTFSLIKISFNFHHKLEEELVC